MAVNPMALLKLKERGRLFTQQHPKFMSFLHAAKKEALVEGSIMEIKIITPDGRTLTTNIRMNSDDIQSVQMLTGIRSSKQNQTE